MVRDLRYGIRCDVWILIRMGGWCFHMLWTRLLTWLLGFLDGCDGFFDGINNLWMFDNMAT